MNLRNLAVQVFFICLTVAGSAFVQPASANTFTPILVHAGGGAYTDSLGQTWSADTGFSGGNVYSTTSPINNTPDPTLYQTERFGALSYQFAVPNGNYNVVLKFAEIYWTSVGQRIFNVSINGTQVLTNFDIVAAAGAPLTAIDETFPVTVTNGMVTIQLITGSADWPKVSALEITQPTIPIRVHAGGGAYTDSLGRTWSADTGFSAGSVASTTSPINNTPDPALYQTERYSVFSYQFAVPNGSYNVVLKFAEIYWTTVGQRIFDVAINGTQVLTNFDIVAAAGAPLTAIDKTFPVTVTNGMVTIQFIPGSTDWPKVSAIEITQGSGTAPTSGAPSLVSPSAATRVHAGGGNYTDSLGQAWSADMDFSGGDVYRINSPISNTPDPGLYQTERFGVFSYQFAVPNGSYNVVLKFAELYWNSVGQRIFNVSINGAQVLTNFDIVAAAGGPLTAIDKTFAVTVTNGTVTIQFIPGSADWPKVSAISLAPLSSTSTPALSPTSTGQVSFSQTSFVFGNVNIGTTASETFTLSNTGTAQIIFSGVSVSGAGFNATGVSSGVTLNPGQSTTLTATFTPATVAAVTGRLVFISNAANPSAAIALSGTGVQPAAHFAFLTWNPSTTSDVVGYYVYRGTASAGPFTVLNPAAVSTTTYTDSTVQSGQVYYYVVTSVDSSSTQSAYSNAVSAMIP